MPAPAVSLKLKNFRRRFGIAAPRVVVRSHLGWHWYAASLVVVLAVVATLVWSLAQRGELAQMREEIGSLRARLSVAADELSRSRASVGTETSVAEMERATRQQLVARIGVLEAENASLREDISLFERLVPAEGSEPSLRVERLRVTPDPEVGQYRYRLLLAFQPSKQLREFRGWLQLAAIIVHAGREREVLFPGEREVTANYWLEVKNFLRKEGGFSIPSGARLKSVEARIWQGESVKARRLVQF